jgi:hypothetical protein
MAETAEITVGGKRITYRYDPSWRPAPRVPREKRVRVSKPTRAAKIEKKAKIVARGSISHNDNGGVVTAGSHRHSYEWINHKFVCVLCGHWKEDKITPCKDYEDLLEHGYLAEGSAHRDFARDGR